MERSDSVEVSILARVLEKEKKMLYGPIKKVKILLTVCWEQKINRRPHGGKKASAKNAASPHSISKESVCVQTFFGCLT